MIQPHDRHHRVTDVPGPGGRPASPPAYPPVGLPRSVGGRSGGLRRVSLTTALALCLLSAGLGAGAVGLAGGPGDSATSASVAAATASAASHADSTSGTQGVAAALSTVSPDASTASSVARDVGPAVVAIITSSTVQSAFGQSFQAQGAGSGVIVDPSGLILTNHHVVGDAKQVSVFLEDGRQYDGTVVGVDTLTDLALLTIDAKDLPAATLGDSSAVIVGEPAIAIGNPEGDLPGSVTAGIVSALERQITVGDSSGLQAAESLRHLIQHDAAINPGNSGGPLIAADGTVIGINTAIAGGAQGIGFAIPIDFAKPIVKQVLAGQAIERPYIGIFYTEVDAQVAKDQALPVTSGALIEGDPAANQPGVIKGGPADEAGVRDGDIVTAIDGAAVDATHQLDVALLQHEPGDSVDLTILRNGKTIDRDVSLGVRPSDTLG